MRREIKRVLAESYIGAIVIGIVAANGLNTLCGLVAEIVQTLAAKSFGQSPLESVQRNLPDTYSLKLIISQLVYAFVPLVVAFVLTRWLYWPHKSSPPVQEQASAPASSRHAPS